MSNRLATLPTAYNNAQQVDPLVTKIARESDFADLLDYAPQRELFTLRSTLEKAVRSVGDIRTPMTELFRMRLAQLRAHLA